MEETKKKTQRRRVRKSSSSAQTESMKATPLLGKEMELQKRMQHIAADGDATGVPEGKKPTKRAARPRVTANRKKSESARENKAQPTLRIIPLGGMGEVGKNMTVLAYEDEMIVIDCGMIFPEGEMLGIDYVIPDTQFLMANKDKIKAFVFTHGHEDHIGATPFILKDLKKVPVYGGRLTTALIQHKLDEHGVKGVHMQTVKAGTKIKIGCFEVTFLKVNHSIADAFALAIRTPVGLLVHTGDFKIDHTPLDGEKMDLAAFARLGQQGVLLLMSDSTNAERPGYTMSEQRVSETFDECFEHAQGRIIVATFSSNISRIQQLIYIAEKRGRKVFFAGRSLERISQIATEIGYLKVKKGTLLDSKQLDYMNDDEVVIITTGSQGEPMSGLVRMASGEHRIISIGAGDLVILSSSPIPGNEKAVSNIIDKLYQRGANVIYQGIRSVHVSGHACQEEEKLMLALTKPKFFMPVHGEFRMLRAHATTAEQQGVQPDHIVLPANGDVVELTKNSVKVKETVPAGAIFVDGSGIGDVGNVVLRDRKTLSEDGLFIAVVAVNRETGALVSGPEIISRGFVYVRENEQLIAQARDLVKKAVAQCQEQHVPGEWGELKSAIRSCVRNFLYQQTKRNPMILPVILEV